MTAVITPYVPYHIFIRNIVITQSTEMIKRKLVLYNMRFVFVHKKILHEPNNQK